MADNNNINPQHDRENQRLRDLNGNDIQRAINEWHPLPAQRAEAPAQAQAAVAAVVPEPLQIQDLDEWLRTNGLPSQESSSTTLDRVEERKRFVEFDRYQKAMHDSIFATEMKQEALQQQERKKQLRVWKDCKMNLLAAQGKVVTNVPLQPMAAACETIFTMASCRRHFQQQKQLSTDTNGTTSSDDGNHDNKDEEENKENLLFSLDDFQESSIRGFVSVVLGEQAVEKLTPDSIVDCCQIAHYVQNSSVFDATVKILLTSIDTSNCLSLCYLADKLNIPLLFERSVGHLMHTMGSLENGCCWQDLSVELRNRILAIKQAIQSSIHDQRRTLYFSSLDEYIAIFAERCQYYRERLAEAKEQQQQLLLSDNHNSDTSSSSSSSIKYTQDVQDKIDRQERRVKALEIALAEQKKLFASAQTTY
jgi:hypothetical protein